MKFKGSRSDQLLTKIAKKHLNLETLENRNSDNLDFHDIAVWVIQEDDEFNVVVWEAVALTLAEKAGITTAKWRLETIIDKPVLILRRFDRQSGKRVPFLSAMNMLGAKDEYVGCKG